MKRVISIMFVLMLLSLVSAEIIIQEQPNDLYNLGEGFSIPVTIKTTQELTGMFSMDLICNGQEVNFYKNGVSLSTGEEKQLEASLILSKILIGNLQGTCKIKGSIGEQYVVTDEFEISTAIVVNAELEKTEINPGEYLFVTGEALKKSGDEVEGFLNIEIIENDSAIVTQMNTISHGFFSANFSLPEDFKAGKYLLKLTAFEIDSSGETTNTGSANFNILVKQKPKSIELVLEDKIEPGTNLQIKPILHDQTEENIPTSIKITIKNNFDEIIMQTSVPTNEVYNYSIKYNEPVAEWSVLGEFEKLNAEKIFEIIEKQDVNISIVNDTILIKNTGNIKYNKTLSVKIGDEIRSIDVLLKIDETKEYKLKAPEGEYLIEVGGGEEKITSTSFLTGRSVEIKEPRTSFIRHTFAWFFIILVLGMATFMLFKKSRKKTFFGYMPSFKKKGEKIDENKLVPIKKDALIKTKNKAESSLSIRGNKQIATIVCLKIKNLKDIENKKNNSEESLQKIINFAEDKKAYIYQNLENIFFILAPTITKTFKNEAAALEIAKNIEKILRHNNKFFKQKIEFGIGINNGIIVAKKEKDALKFMSMGTTITTCKRLSTKSKAEILLSEDIRDKLKSYLKEEKVDEGIYRIKEFKAQKPEYKSFIENFVKKQEKENKEKLKE